MILRVLKISNNTLQNIPQSPHTEELLILSILQGNKEVPAVYVLSQEVSELVYWNIWQHLIIQAPGLENCLQTVSGEVSKIMAAAILSVLPTVQFRYSSLLYTRVKTIIY